MALAYNRQPNHHAKFSLSLVVIVLGTLLRKYRYLRFDLFYSLQQLLTFNMAKDSGFHCSYQDMDSNSNSVQAALAICRVHICEFAYSNLKIGQKWQFSSQMLTFYLQIQDSQSKMTECIYLELQGTPFVFIHVFMYFLVKFCHPYIEHLTPNLPN